MKLNLLVIRTANLEALKEQYEQLGFNFAYHQHGKGPFHYASEIDGYVFEIYPIKTEITDNPIRLGFDIEHLETKLLALESTDWKIISGLKETEWGLTAVIQDLDGRKVELRNI